MTVTDEQFDELLRRQLDGTATGNQLRELDRAMRQSPERVREYVAMRETESLLEWELGFAEVNLSFPELRRREKASAFRPAALLVPLAAAAGLAVAFLFGMQFGGRVGEAKPEETLAAAVLFDSEDAVWRDAPGIRSFGAPFQTGRSYRLESGVVRLAFANGAGLAIEGPAAMTVASADRVEITEGKIAAYVPDEAVGFVVATPGMNIVDLGTKFGAEIRPSGGSEVHVFEGQVEVEQAGDRGRRLIEAGEGLRYESGEPTSIEAREEAFAPPPSLEQLLSMGQAGETPKGKAPRTSLGPIRENADLLALEDFGLPPGEIDGENGALGFGENSWKASRLHTQIVRRSGEDQGGRLLIRGRQASEPYLVNRVSIELEKVLPSDFFVSVSGRYDGHDENDFFAFWVDSNDRRDSSHVDAPNVGIRHGNFFARTGLDDTAIGPLAGDSRSFTLLMKVERNTVPGVATVKLWDADFDGPPAAEVSAACDWASKSFRYLGIRMGKDTDVNDKLIVDRIAIGSTLEAVSAQP